MEREKFQVIILEKRFIEIIHKNIQFIKKLLKKIRIKNVPISIHPTKRKKYDKLSDIPLNLIFVRIIKLIVIIEKKINKIILLSCFMRRKETTVSKINETKSNIIPTKRITTDVLPFNRNFWVKKILSLKYLFYVIKIH
ncbi:MAG: hypothetical protein P8Y97_03460 [Candidatus Lokiarchaeota archaeon]